MLFGQTTMTDQPYIKAGLAVLLWQISNQTRTWRMELNAHFLILATSIIIIQLHITQAHAITTAEDKGLPQSTTTAENVTSAAPTGTTTTVPAPTNATATALMNATGADPTNTTSPEEGYFSSLCRRVPRIVNFHDDLFMTFIIRPMEFDLGDCVGYCPTLYGHASTYTQIKSRLDRNYSPCCVPTEFKPLAVALPFYSREKKKVITHIDLLEDASVKSCGCHWTNYAWTLCFIVSGL